MSELAFFASTAITPQSANQGYGVESIDKFRVSSLFSISANAKAYGMVQGTILLQQQTSDADKVNLILRPHNQKELKLPVKYIIYRGLSITDFIANNDLTDPNNKVNTSGSELLAAMQTIQQDRAPGDDIPLEAFFGNDLTPANDKNIDEFFFKSLAPSSQLFTIDCGIELGNFATGEIGIEIVLENPEFFVDVELAKEAKHERDVSGITDATQKKWEKNLVRHFVEPAAFYGLHYDIKEGIEYRDGSGNKQSANTKSLVYNEVLEPFGNTTRNTVYLDIRNENGYSYNYYGNYVGTGTDANKELEIGQTPTGLTKKEYYTNGWAMHIVDVITSGSNEENEFSIALRVNDNERPLLAGWNVELSPYSEVDPSLSNDTSNRVYFTDETHLLPTPIPNPLPAFTNVITVKVPNVPSETKQLATVVKLDYIKQLRLNDNADSFPQENPTDYLFGPITTQIPWDSEDGVQWIGSSHHKYFDGLNHGFVLGDMEEDITSLDSSLKTITINKKIDAQITNKVNIINSTNPQNVGEYNVIKVENPTSTSTAITVLESFPGALQTGDKLKITIEAAVSIEYGSKKVIAESIDLSGVSAFAAGQKIRIFLKKGAETVNTVASNTYASGNTEIIFNNGIDKQGLGCIMEIGMVSETDLSTSPNNPPDSDNILFYAVPQFYYKKTGNKDARLFNYEGATHNGTSFIKTLQKFSPDFKIEKYNLQPTTGNFIATLAYDSGVKVKENILLLGLKKSEFEDLKAAATAGLSPYHLQMLKLKPQGNRLRDKDYEPYYKYHAVIAGLDSSGDYAETTVYKEIYSRDGLIFTSPEYARTGSSQFAIVLDEALDKLLDINNRSFPNLTNVTYEERNQLDTWWLQVPSKNPPVPSYAKTNKVLYLLDGYTLNNEQYTLTGVLNTLPLELRNELDILYSNYPNTDVPVNEIETLLSQKGSELIVLARQRIREVNQPYTNKDGILYLVRLMMQLVLKNHKTVVNSASGYQYFSDVFEKASRGWSGSAKPSFSGYPSNYKRVLISGFDPFGAGFDWEGYNSNSSGNIALALDGELIEDSGGNDVGVIRSTIFPVRYKEFNDEQVEKFFRPFIPLVDMIITFSYGIDNYDFQIDRFASDFRYGTLDGNNSQTGLDTNLNIGETFIENILPYGELAVGNVLEIPGSPCVIGLNHRAYWEIYADQISPELLNQNVTNLHSLSRAFQIYRPPYTFWNNRSVIPIDMHLLDPGKPQFDDHNFFNNSQVSNDLKFVDSGDSDYIKFPSWMNYPDSQPWTGNFQNFKIKARMGSGQFYFSNEIHYRVSNLRNTLRPNLKTGHIHIGFLKEDPVTDRGQMLTDIKYIIEKMINSL